MRSRFLINGLIIAALAGPAVVSGCASHRTYDPYYQWDGRDRAYYERWEIETHRVHRDYWRRDAGDQRAYWDWRKRHANRDRDRDYDRDHDRD